MVEVFCYFFCRLSFMGLFYFNAAYFEFTGIMLCFRFILFRRGREGALCYCSTGFGILFSGRFPAGFDYFFIPACQGITPILHMIQVYNDVISKCNRVDLKSLMARNLLIASLD